ncbi:LOW QUALITY PROTEIN: L-proline trans-4-hydroxylase-like [Pecten maximus]|uniref:LOW QUALITY PROTEIN: L-proline trans-4-hydroxylase-like n=1 Tax=Pecten maximus TaxID=6579 RepID=UPI00145833A9|nr:LOW QUALITY PROTEIN: L-proline trans-4-hydroxylase-like [Pecten maximus]
MATLSGVYNYTSEDFRVTDDMKKSFDDLGYILVRGLFNGTEISKLRKVFEETSLIKDHGWGVVDDTGKITKLAVWNSPGNDVSGMMARCEKVVNTSEDLLRDEVYHYHGKLLYKEPLSGGSFLWHQDYGYWYKNSCLFPDMMTVFVAIDKCIQANGCLQILPGSHRCGRIDHDMSSGQTAANVDRVEAIKKICQPAFVEMDSGDALFFHCNLLHCSSANDSPDRRWAYLIAYNTKSNNPVVPHHHAQYTPIQKVPNSAVTDCTNYRDFTDKDFMEAKSSKTVNATFLESDSKQ